MEESFVRALRLGAEKLGISLDRQQMRLYGRHFRLLVEWNRRFNLTSVTNAAEVAIKLFLDSLVPLPFIPLEYPLLDMGSGGGFPGIPLKVAQPCLEVHLADSSRRKVSFQKQVILELGLERIHAHHFRLGQGREGGAPRAGFGTVICRALGPLQQIVRWGLPYLKKGGLILALKGPRVESELPGIEREGVHLVEVARYRLPLLGHRRVLVVLKADKTKFRPPEG